MSSSSTDWQPPAKIEEYYNAGTTAGNQWSSINAPTAGARVTQDLVKGSAPFQLYSLATPNGQKVGIMLEELGIDYDAHVVIIGKGEQFTSGFVGVNPNSKIPSAVDLDGPGGQPINLFESGSIVLYLAEKHGRFLPSDPRLRTEVMNWVFWQMGSQGPMTGQFAHFFMYAPGDKVETRTYSVTRYGMEVQRNMSVLDQHLATRTYMVGEEYTIADIMCFPYANGVFTGVKHSSGIAARDFLSADQYSNVAAWIDRIKERPAVQRGVTVCHHSGVGKPWLSAETK